MKNKDEIGNAAKTISMGGKPRYRRMISAMRMLLLVLLMAAFQITEIKAAWTDFDTSFGFQGVTVDPVTGHVPRDVAIQPDGSILVTGYRTTTFGGNAMFLRRYLSDGQLDLSFGSNGAASGGDVTFRGSDYRGQTILIEPNGKIAVAGAANGFYAVWHFTSTGRRDPVFGDNGLKILTQYPVPGTTAPVDLNIQSGRLLVSLPKGSGVNSRLVLVRLSTSGGVDTSFGTHGEAMTDISAQSVSFGTVVESHGPIVVSGKKFNEVNASGLDRLLANGDPDPTFFPTSVNPGTPLPGLLRASDGGYVLGLFNLASNGSLTLVLFGFTASGNLDGTVTPFNDFYVNGCPDIFASQSDGRFIVEFQGRLFRRSDDLHSGTTEMTACSNLGGKFYYAAIQGDNKMVSAGIYNGRLVLARTLP